MTPTARAIRRFLCWIGLHRWYTGAHYRNCRACGLRQEWQPHFGWMDLEQP